MSDPILPRWVVKRAAVALTGGEALDHDPDISEDGPEAAAIWGVAEQWEDGVPSQRVYRWRSDGVLVVGLRDIAGKRILTSHYSTVKRAWDGLRYRR